MYATGDSVYATAALSLRIIMCARDEGVFADMPHRGHSSQACAGSRAFGAMDHIYEGGMLRT